MVNPYNITSSIAGTCPDESSILMHALLLNHYMYSAAYPVGGASEIAYNIIPVIERAGGRVLVRANGMGYCKYKHTFCHTPTR